MTMYTRILAGLALAMTSCTLLAADAAPPLDPEWPDSQAELWLQLQRGGEVASRRVQSATPTERELSMQRLLDSYSHPIPEYFGEDDGGSFER
ncbi:DUF3613 domain-containing protein [Halopseudomonas bauzanensis]|uniref:DUF3613 domain-containing protein n=1 Tax=Halopseudomonas bauzanensis TaxID=653930 RepID=UPI003524F67B